MNVSYFFFSISFLVNENITSHPAFDLFNKNTKPENSPRHTHVCAISIYKTDCSGAHRQYGGEPRIFSFDWKNPLLNWYGRSSNPFYIIVFVKMQKHLFNVYFFIYFFSTLQMSLFPIPAIYILYCCCCGTNTEECRISNNDLDNVSTRISHRNAYNLSAHILLKLKTQNVCSKFWCENTKIKSKHVQLNFVNTNLTVYGK